MRPWENSKPVSSQSVQQAYVSSRLREINSKKNEGLLVEKTLDALAQVPSLANANRLRLAYAYAHLTKRLQDADLTINFRAPSWFTDENNSESYTQMYERAVQGGRVVLSNRDPLNPAVRRVENDNLVTLPKSWEQATLQAQRGLSPDAGRGRMVKKISPGRLEPVKRNLWDDDPGQEFVASNLQFDPHTKQVFAALNYGRRFHGSSTQYGHSYMVLDDKFKTNALYFAGDTFLANQGFQNTAKHQVSYQLLAGLLCKTRNNQKLREDLIKSCLQDITLPDTADEHLLVEAHLFEKVVFRGNITDLCFSFKDRPRDAAGNEQDWTGDLVTRVRSNAKKFATRHSAKLTWLD